MHFAAVCVDTAIPNWTIKGLMAVVARAEPETAIPEEQADTFCYNLRTL
jgi:hypothetical protein